MAQRRNIMVDICHFCCVNYFVFSGSQRSVTDVFKNTAGKQPGILKNERKQAAKITSVHVPDINSVNFDDYESRNYFDRQLRKCGLFDRLEELGIRDGDTVSIYDWEFTYER